MKCTVYYQNKGKNARIQYNGVRAMQAGPAWQILGEADADGNGVPRNAPLILLRLDNGNTATFDADNVTILCD